MNKLTYSVVLGAISLAIQLHAVPSLLKAEMPLQQPKTIVISKAIRSKISIVIKGSLSCLSFISIPLIIKVLNDSLPDYRHDDEYIDAQGNSHQYLHKQDIEDFLAKMFIASVGGCFLSIIGTLLGLSTYNSVKERDRIVKSHNR